MEMYKVENKIFLYHEFAFDNLALSGSNINIKQRNPSKRVILYSPYNSKTTSVSQNKSKFFLLCLQSLRDNVTNFVMLSCFSENRRNLIYTTDIAHSNIKQSRA